MVSIESKAAVRPFRLSLYASSAVLAAVLAGCAATPEPHQTLEQARSQYAMLEARPGAMAAAALELDEAEQSIDRAQAAWESGAEEEKVDHLAYLAAQKVEIAEQTVQLRQAEKTLDEAGTARAQVQLQARTAEARNAEQNARQAQQRAQQAEQRANALETQLQDLQAKQTERGAVVTFGDVLFDFDEAELKRGGLRNVTQLADFLSEHEERQVLIEGFTDSVGAEEYNRQLSERRANAVRDALVEEGISASRLRTRGYGEAFPIASNDSEGSRQLNRRVEVVISDDASQVEDRR